MSSKPFTIPVISLWQPWATAMALRIKKNETRSWPNIVRGWLAIHAAKRPLDRQARLLWTASGPTYEPLVFGAVVCVVRVVGCERTELIKKLGVSEQEKRWGNYDDGRWAWVTSPVDMIELPKPIPLRGRQGLFRWAPPDWLAQELKEKTP
jgi:hypothetical protein